MKVSPTSLIVAVVPSVAMLPLFYSLAIHMFRALGGWPTSIGERDFPPALILHASIDMWFCVALLGSILFILPVAFLICCLVARWRRFLPYP